ncbi:MAG: ankyrin repeat domain-containing protein [Truepera sp.]|nr:ankyrin repeat domain-containing protein [Truepera sp.]
MGRPASYCLMNLAVITALVDAGSDMEAWDRRGRTPLHLAAQNSDNPAVIEALLNVGADAATQDSRGNVPWVYAMANEALVDTGTLRRLAEGGFESKLSQVVNGGERPASTFAGRGRDG